jgi:hypothetical protein
MSVKSRYKILLIWKLSISWIILYRWMDGWMDGWVGGWVGGWMDGFEAFTTNKCTETTG